MLLRPCNHHTIKPPPNARMNGIRSSSLGERLLGKSPSTHWHPLTENATIRHHNHGPLASVRLPCHGMPLGDSLGLRSRVSCTSRLSGEFLLGLGGRGFRRGLDLAPYLPVVTNSPYAAPTMRMMMNNGSACGAIATNKNKTTSVPAQIAMACLLCSAKRNSIARRRHASRLQIDCTRYHRYTCSERHSPSSLTCYVCCG